jgi:hypothetical protein
VPPERTCATSDGAGGPGPSAPGRGAPETTLRGKPAKRSRDRTPSFRFVADETGASFECRLDGKPFKPCRSPFTTPALSPSRHVFRVRARDGSGQIDPSAATYAFRVLPRRR